LPGANDVSPGERKRGRRLGKTPGRYASPRKPVLENTLKTGIFCVSPVQSGEEYFFEMAMLTFRILFYIMEKPLRQCIKKQRKRGCGQRFFDVNKSSLNRIPAT